MKTKRTYTMTARARAVEKTRRRILGATFELSDRRKISAISLEDVAQRAGVSVQTILRQFGSRAGLLEATTAHAVSTVTEERATPVGDVESAVRVIVDHYELRGDAVLLRLAQESEDEQVRVVTERGRRLHRRWVEEVFSPYVGPDDPMTDLLVVATDVYTWKLLRRDRGLSRAQTEERIKHLVTALLPATKGASA
jgi:AcrR family transcriptional regulator